MVDFDDEDTRTGSRTTPPGGHRRGIRPRLVLLSGVSVRRTWEIHDKLMIGRGSEADVQLSGDSVSRLHCEITRAREEQFHLNDLDSRNGTLVNGIRVQSCVLKFGDEIQLANDAILLFTRHSAVEEELAHNQKMEAIGRLAAGIAHDFNNLLAVIFASLEYLECVRDDAWTHGAEIEECVADARNAANQASLLTRQLLGFARPEPSPQGPVDVAGLIGDVVQLIRRTFDRSIAIETEVGTDLIVHGDKSRLFQTLMNLALNARDAMPNGGMLRLGATLDREGRTPFVEVTVEDNGTGMDAESRKRVFEPFFSTKSGGKGTGLGLAMVYGTVRTHGGDIEVESEPGEGALFRIRLPAVDGRPRSSIPRELRATDAFAFNPRSHRLLVVDDEELVLRSMRRVLQQLGHEVHAVSNGADALRVYQNEANAIDAVILDLNMPDMSGEETAARLRDIDPSVKIVFLSGYWDKDRAGLMAAGAQAVLEKPCSVERISQILQHVISKPGPDAVSSEETDPPGERDT